MSVVVDAFAPLILADGTKIDPSNGRVLKEPRQSQFIEVPSGTEAQAIVARTRRSIAELPLVPQNMNALSLCLTYTLWGLSDNDIAVATSLTVEQVKRIKALPQYTTMSDDITRTVLEHQTNDIRKFFQRKASGAAEKIVAIAEEDDGVLGFKAAQDVLDRAGHRPADVVEHRLMQADALRIEHIVRQDETTLPVIETSYRDVTDGDSPRP